jgi:hypothetical protein
MDLARHGANQPGVMLMKTRTAVASLFLAGGIAVAAVGFAMAQGGMMGGDMMHRDAGQGMMGRGMMQGDRGHGMMSGGMMGHMMHGGGSMKCPMMGGTTDGMMQNNESRSGMGSLFGSRVLPTMNLSPDDVRGYLSEKLDHLGNKRLKIGDVKADGGSITADIITADNSLVQRMKVDRATGNIEYEN